MQVEISTGLIAVAVTVGGVIVSAAVTMMLAARDARDAARDVERHADTLTALQVGHARHEERLATHTEEIGGLRAKAHEHANLLARISMRCDLEHGGE